VNRRAETGRRDFFVSRPRAAFDEAERIQRLAHLFPSVKDASKLQIDEEAAYSASNEHSAAKVRSLRRGKGLVRTLHGPSTASAFYESLRTLYKWHLHGPTPREASLAPARPHAFGTLRPRAVFQTRSLVLTPGKQVARIARGLAGAGRTLIDATACVGGNALA
jgi:hypothetical protein